MRAPAPPYANEGPHALWHVSEDEIELRVLPSLWPLWNEVVGSTLEYSGVRLRNAQPGK